MVSQHRKPLHKPLLCSHAGLTLWYTVFRKFSCSRTSWAGVRPCWFARCVALGRHGTSQVPAVLLSSTAWGWIAHLAGKSLCSLCRCLGQACTQQRPRDAGWTQRCLFSVLGGMALAWSPQPFSSAGTFRMFHYHCYCAAVLNSLECLT